MKKFLQLELNEVNFEYVRAYGERGKLPTLNRLIDTHGLQETYCEKRYEELEPWVQWVSAHTGLPLAGHRVFRLGDINEQPDVAQIWETLEGHGLSVGAVSPMNAANRCKNPAFFIPDPWTQTSATGSPTALKLYEAVVSSVNENAKGGSPSGGAFASLLQGLLRYGRPQNGLQYVSQTMKSAKQKWRRAIVLDQLLADYFVRETKAKSPDYATLFLNAAAHIQHHYMFNSAAYRGEMRNPDWYLAPEEDPVLEVYSAYDRIVSQAVEAFPEARIIIATGLHQDPYQHPLYYWRLSKHADFIAKLGVECERVEPRMSRDFVIYFGNEEAARAAEARLGTVKASDGVPLFTIDNRGTSLFVELTYPSEIMADTLWQLGNEKSGQLRSEVTLVALKNGEHNGTGYVIDTDHDATAREPYFLGELHTMTCDHFNVSQPAMAAE